MDSVCPLEQYAIVVDPAASTVVDLGVEARAGSVGSREIRSCDLAGQQLTRFDLFESWLKSLRDFMVCSLV